MFIEELHGSWELESMFGEREDGSREYLYGQDTVGRLTYLPDGHIMVFVGGRNRQKFAGWPGSPAEIKAAFESFDAYTGRYTVDLEQGIVTHHVTMARLPDWENSDQVRYFTLADNRLEIRTPPIPYGDQSIVVYANWVREA